ncbi:MULTISPECIES: hypothetical protein [unclassified Bradyrhizobium]|uniref:hypothetical protein n=1 Tax=unclassified Bradyrhizobium TaxID=2631580 RepID=UPI001BAC0534|nr:MULTISPECIES: hypothetical protein [unclassified Bradyrhizobium]MBR1202621.1 hypothetical protein [Bradyrhizobium sp. AUGA SZCCT0124]MBR1310810.1 hypothetical protein [Bradyrhizobium sp. AUGA SZCCT0051]MBR1339570.1 hypothetical protein [Bradyrhizobium sp. AUGA SZCCT0105]MBR1354144.1 hypothetical protein [Bradyrhizobium sp. AUGA SZCCT0045]
MSGGVHRTGAVVGALLALLAAQPVAWGAAAESGADDASLLYLSSGDWQRQSAPRKVALAADFMRIFCTDQRMSAASLADCLDRDKGDGTLFERAMACVSALSAGR